MEINKIQNAGPFEIEVKRFYIPFRIVGKCPVCGGDFERDISHDYFSNPIANAWSKEYMYHYNEETEEECEFELDIFLSVDLEVK